MTRPLVKCELSLSPPASLPNWVDISEYFMSCEINRGTQDVLSRFEAGVLESLVLDNTDRRFDPDYAGEIINLVTNPSFEVDLDDWSNPLPSFGTFTRITSDSAIDASCAEIDANGTLWVYLVEYFIDSTSIEIGGQYTVSIYLKGNIPTNELGLVQIICLDPFDVVLLAENVGAITGPITETQWTRYSHTFTIPVGTDLTKVIIRVLVFNQDGVTPVNGSLKFDGVQFEEGSGSLYCDGDQDNCRWAGAEHASQTYRGGPYYPFLKIMRRIRVAGILDEVEYAQITAYLEDTEQEFPAPYESDATFRGTDAFLVLNLKKVTGAFSQERSDLRIGAILSAVGYTTGTSWILGSVGSQLGVDTVVGPVGDRQLDQGLTTVAAKTYDKEPALSAIQEIVDTENGLFFVNKEGAMVFHNRHHLVGISGSQAIFGDDWDNLEELPYKDPILSRDETNIWNSITVTREGGTPQTLSDADSIEDYFQRDRDIQTLHLTDAEALSSAGWVLHTQKQPETRVLGILLDPEGLDEELESRVWQQMLQRELGDKVTIYKTPVVGPRMVQPSMLIGIKHSISVEDGWTTIFRFAPYLLDDFWIVGDTGDPSKSILGISTVVGY